jgi:hypothetical protein
MWKAELLSSSLFAHFCGLFMNFLAIAALQLHFKGLHIGVVEYIGCKHFLSN